MENMERRKMIDATLNERIDGFLKWVIGMCILAPALGFTGGIIAILLDGPEGVVIISSVTTINVMVVYGAYKMKKELNQHIDI
jgi:hypothetical protein